MRSLIVAFLSSLCYCRSRSEEAARNRTQVDGGRDANTFVVPFWRGFMDSQDWTPSGRSFITDKRMLWPNARIPYYIDRSVTNVLRKKISQYVDFFNKYTCVKWVKGNRNDRAYVMFKYGPLPCWSFIGRLGRQQDINLNNACVMDTGHEMMHAMGFIHEHTRVDRDCYVGIRNDLARANHNYQHYRRFHTDTRFPYDYNSVMQYPAYFGRNPIIWGIGPEYTRGKCIGPFSWALMTNIDIWKVNTLYCNKQHYCQANKSKCQYFEQYERNCLKRRGRK